MQNKKINTWCASFSLAKDEAIYFPEAASGEQPLEKSHILLVENEGSDDKWRSARTIGAYDSGQKYFEIEIVNDAHSTNTWRICVGVVPTDFDSEQDRIWVGSQKSWSYISGSGGKCYNSGQMISYAEPYNTGDVIGVWLDFDKSEIEFLKNGVSQGIAFSNLKGPVHGAVSLTGTGAKARFRNCSVEEGLKKRNQTVEMKKEITYIEKTFGNIWNIDRCSKDLVIDSNHTLVENTNNSNKWRVAVGKISYSSGRRYFEFVIKTNPSTINTWKLVVGLVNNKFKLNAGKIWIGAQNTWGYIAGTGGKVHASGRSVSYGGRFGKGDRIGILMDFDNRTIEFFKNGVSQGDAFQNLVGPVYPAISMTGKGTKILLDANIEKSKTDELILYH